MNIFKDTKTGEQYAVFFTDDSIGIYSGYKVLSVEVLQPETNLQICTISDEAYSVPQEQLEYVGMIPIKFRNEK